MVPKSEFVRHVGILAGGTAFAQGLSVLALPILTRLYSPEAFGLLATYMALIGMVAVVSCLRLNLAIPLPEHDDEAINLLGVSLAATAITSTIIALAVTAMPGYATFLLKQPEMRPFLWMIPVGVFFASSYDALQYWATRRKQFMIVTRTRITRALGGAGTQLAIGVASGGGFGLLFGHMVYGGLGVVGLARTLWRTDRTVLKALSIQSAQAALRRYSHFPTRSVPAAIMDAGHHHIPILLIASIVSGSQMGVIFLAIQAISVPISLVGSAISQVYLADASARIAGGDLGKFTRKIMALLAIFGGPILISISTLAYYLSGAVFGERFAPAGIIILQMTPWFIVQLICSPVSSVFAVAQRQGQWLALQTIGFLLIVGSTAIAALYFQAHIVEVFVWSSALFYSLINAVIVLITYRLDRVL